MSESHGSDSRKAQDAPTYWFAVLVMARERQDFEQAAEAQRQLKRLGVTVNYARRGPRK